MTKAEDIERQREVVRAVCEEFPDDCKASGYVPVLVVLDPTEADKLTVLRERFEAAGGLAYVGPEAWAHLGVN